MPFFSPPLNFIRNSKSDFVPCYRPNVFNDLWRKFRDSCFRSGSTPAKGFGSEQLSQRDHPRYQPGSVGRWNYAGLWGKGSFGGAHSKKWGNFLKGNASSEFICNLPGTSCREKAESSWRRCSSGLRKEGDQRGGYAVAVKLSKS